MKYDFEDVIGGGIKTKFKYLKVKPESFGLSDEQILYGDDKELNKYVSIKRLAAYDEEDVRLRNNIYDHKIGSIDRSARQNKKMVTNNSTKVIRNIQKIKSRAEILKKRRFNLRDKLRLVNLSNPADEKKYFLPQYRLESYGLTE